MKHNHNQAHEKLSIIHWRIVEEPLGIRGPGTSYFNGCYLFLGNQVEPFLFNMYVFIFSEIEFLSFVTRKLSSL